MGRNSIGALAHHGAVNAAMGAPALTLEIADTGEGLTREQQARLFRPFEQADNSSTRKHGGTGLGLVICQRLTQMRGGTSPWRASLGAAARSS